MSTPVIGMRVRRIKIHPFAKVGDLGTIDVVGENGLFWVATDDGGFNGWCSFEEWEPVTR